MDLKKLLDAVNESQARKEKISAQIVGLFDQGKTEEAVKLQDDLDKAKQDYKTANQLYLSVLDAVSGDGDPARRFVPANSDKEPQKVTEMRASREYSQQFWNAFKAGASPKTIKGRMHSAEDFPMLMNAITETGGTPAGSEGGFLNPVDFDNMIHQYQSLAVDLAPYVNVENVTMYSGWRVFEKAAAALPFALINKTASAGQRLQATESPEFEKLEYTVKDYGGFLPVDNFLLSDTPVNIMAYLAKWMGRKVSLTNTSLVMAIINALSTTAVSDYKTVFARIKTALNKTLDPAISANASIFVNQSGLDLLDQLTDGTGRPLLQPDPSNATQNRIKGRLVVPVPSSQWADLDGPARTRIVIGDAREVVTLFRRQAMETDATNIGGNAWRDNNTEVRAIMRADVKSVDTSAAVVLAVQLPS
jgi:HK97 family phage major capsid protein